MAAFETEPKRFVRALSNVIKKEEWLIAIQMFYKDLAVIRPFFRHRSSRIRQKEDYHFMEENKSPFQCHILEDEYGADIQGHSKGIIADDISSQTGQTSVPVSEGVFPGTSGARYFRPIGYFKYVRHVCSR